MTQVRPLTLLGLTLMGAAAVSTAACGGGGSSSTGGSSPPSSASQGGAGAATDTNPPGDIPDTQAYVPVPAADGSWTVRVPEGWARTVDARSVTYTSHYNAVRLETLDAASPPTVESARQTELPGVLRSVAHGAPHDVTAAQRAGQPVVVITYQADSAPDPVTGKVARLDLERYEFWRAGKEAVVTVSSPVGSDNVDPWRTVTDSFAWR